MAQGGKDSVPTLSSPIEVEVWCWWSGLEFQMIHIWWIHLLMILDVVTGALRNSTSPDLTFLPMMCHLDQRSNALRWFNNHNLMWCDAWQNTTWLLIAFVSHPLTRRCHGATKYTRITKTYPPTCPRCKQAEYSTVSFNSEHLFAKPP